MRRTSALLSALVASALVASLAGCAPAASEPDTGLTIVASTDVYADIARQIAGDGVTVTAIIDGGAKDPHEYEASAQDQLAVSKAELLIENGGGYDDFFDQLVDASGNSTATVLNAVELSGFDAGDGELNEHVWFDFGTIATVATAIENELVALDADNAAIYQQNAEAFTEDLNALIDTRTALAEQVAGTAVAVTEPLPLYLLDALALVNKTPADFSEAIEEGVDAPADVMQDMLALLTDNEVSLLVVNEQTSGPQTDAVVVAAGSAGVPVVGLTETLPDGDDYQTWMAANLETIGAQLGQ